MNTHFPFLISIFFFLLFACFVCGLVRERVFIPKAPIYYVHRHVAGIFRDYHTQRCLTARGGVFQHTADCFVFLFIIFLLPPANSCYAEAAPKGQGCLAGATKVKT